MITNIVFTFVCVIALYYLYTLISVRVDNSHTEYTEKDWIVELYEQKIWYVMELARRMHAKYGMNLTPFDVVFIAHITKDSNTFLVEREVAVEAKRLRRLPPMHYQLKELTDWLHWQMTSKHRAFVHTMTMQPYPSLECFNLDRWKYAHLYSVEEEEDEDI